MNLDRLPPPPQSIEAEMSVLGGILVDNDVIDTVHSVISCDSFYRETHRHIFRAMTVLADKGEPIDYVTLTSELKNKGVLEEVGGGAYIAVLVDYVPIAANTVYYCRIIAQKATERRIAANAQEAARIVFSGGDIAEAVSLLEKAIEPASASENSHPVSLAHSLKDTIKRIERRFENRGNIQGLPYGIDDLDAATSGMHPGELIIIAGRPSMGKSALAGNIFSNAGSLGKCGLLFTLEMSRGDYVDRMAAAHGVKYQNIRSGNMQDPDWAHLTKGMGAMYNWDLHIDDTPAISLREIRAKAKRLKKESDLALIVIDYLQLMTIANLKDNRVQGIGEISRGLKQLARELELPVVLLSQLNRSVDSRPDKRPMMSDLRDSGEIEQDADVILFPYRPAAYCQKCKDKIDDNEHNTKEHQAKAEIIIEKQRAGERNLSIPACWVGQHQRFDNMEAAW